MSSDSPSPLRSRFRYTPTGLIVVLAWLVLVIGSLVWPRSAPSTAESSANDVSPNNTKSGGGQGNNRPGAAAELARSQQESLVLAERLNRLEAALVKQGGIDAQLALAESERAVRRMNAASLSAQARSAERDLGQLRKLYDEWAVLEAALLHGEAGSRIVGSARHFPLVMDLWQRERPSTEQLDQWEQQLAALAEPITNTSAEQATIAITDEHSQLLSDLGQQLSSTLKDFSQQKLLLESLQKETSGLKAANLSLAEAMANEHAQRERAEFERLAAARQSARQAVEQEHAARIAAVERELLEAKTKREEQRILAEKSREEVLAAMELKQITEEQRVQEMQRKARIAGLTEEAKREEDDLRWAQLEREMDRDMNEIKGLLTAFTSPGFAYRSDGTKGPVPFTVIKSASGLEATRKGLQNLFFIAVGNNDRPRGGLPPGVGGQIVQETPVAPIERAQELLKKYGELMVRKGMLGE